MLAACAEPLPPPAPRNPAAEAKVLVQGFGPGKTCRNDRDCELGAARAVCTLGTCFGLLTTDERVTRSLLLTRLAAADPAVQQAAAPGLLAALVSDTTTTGQRLAAIAGLGEVLAGREDAEIRTTLRLFAGNADEALAVTARLTLGRLGDREVQPALLEDLTRGTELLRAEAARALQRQVTDAAVCRALRLALADASPVVQLAAVQALAPVAADPEVRRELQQLAQRSPAVRYDIERLLAGGGK